MSRLSCGCPSNNCTCRSQVQCAPTPCCESHTFRNVIGICFYPTCNVTATDPYFYLSFSNCGANDVPLNANDVFFYHAAAGKLAILGFNGTSYQLALTDPSKAGAVIAKGDCVVLDVDVGGNSPVNPNVRCLSGHFEAPALNASQTIYIINGSSIPTGATLVFVWEGTQASYLVTGFVSSQDNVYAYTVSNTGSGLTPGVIVTGTAVGGVCSVGIEVLTTITICDLPSSTVVDSLVGCLSDSGRAYTPEADGSIPVGVSGQWGQAKITNLDCCATITNCLKFSGLTCPYGQDSVTVNPANIDCFVAALTQSSVQGNGTPGMIGDFPVIILAYDAVNHVVTVVPRDSIGDQIITFEAGAQICLGDCCNTCLNGPMSSNVEATAPGQEANYAFTVSVDDDVPLAWDDGGPRHYLIGRNSGTGATQVLEIDANYHLDPQPGTGHPAVGDPLIIREKICNSYYYTNGCDQTIDLMFNYQLIVDPIPVGLRVHYQVKHFMQGSLTLADTVTPNPYFSVSTQAGSSGYIDGPSYTTALTYLVDTSIGFGNADSAKVFPEVEKNFIDHGLIAKCNCALSIVWLYIQLEPLANIVGTDGAVNLEFLIRRFFRLYDTNTFGLPLNANAIETFNTTPP